MNHKVFSAVLLLLPILVYGAEEQLPDPTRPFAHEVEPELIIQEHDSGQQNITWRLNGIRIADTGRSAILNGQIVRVGDSVSGARVLEIEPAWIIIEHENQHIRLELLDINIKRDKQAMAQNSEMEPK